MVNDEDFFWDGVDQRMLLVQKCTGCGALRHPPAPMCWKCNSVTWEPVPLSGKGRVYSWIISKHPTRPDDAPRTVVLADMEEGVRFVANLIDPRRIDIGTPVEVTFREVNGSLLPQFCVVDDA